MATGAVDPDLHKLNIVSHDGNVEEVVRNGDTDVRIIWKEGETIGRGGFGSVRINRAVVDGKEEVRAVKTISQGFYTSNGIDFKREVQALIAVKDHQDLFVRFFGWYEDSHDFYIAMEYAKDGDLGNYIKKFRGKAEYALNVLSITKQLLEAFLVLHERDIYHRDLKPQNVLIASLSPLQVKLADFGASKSTILVSRLKTQYISHGYSAPEMYGLLDQEVHYGSKYPFALDMWAFGCLVHEILTGEALFVIKGPTWYGIQTDMALLFMFCSGQAALPTEALERLKVDDEATNFIKRLLVANPEWRMSAAVALEHKWLVQSRPLAAPGQGDASTTTRSLHASPSNTRAAETSTLERRQRGQADIPWPVSSNNLPKFLFRAFHTGDSPWDPFYGFKAGRQNDISDALRLREHFNPSDPTRSISATRELLNAINIACNFWGSGKKGVSIAVIDVEACRYTRHISNQDPNQDEFLLSPQMLTTSIIGCVSLDYLRKNRLYELVPELDGELGEFGEGYDKVSIQKLRMIIKNSQSEWETADRLKEIGYKAARVARLFGLEKDDAYFISIQVAEWWDRWWSNGVIDKEILDNL